MKPEIKKRLEMIRRGEVPAGYKKTKVGIIPEEWEIEKLVNEVRFNGGNAFDSEDNAKSGIKWLKISNVGIGNTKWDEISYLPIEYQKRYNQYLLSEGDIVMALTRPILNNKLKICQLRKTDVPALLNQRVAKLEKIKNIDLKYFYFIAQMKKFVDNLNKIISGSDPPNIGNNELNNVVIAMPVKNDQSSIVKILSMWDQAIEKQEKLIELKKEQKKGLAHKLLTGKIRLANFKGKWQNKSLADYFEKIYDKNNENNTNILTMSAQSGLIRQEHFFSKQVASENLSRYFLLKKGDYAYNKSYSAGYPLGAIKRLDNFEKGILSPLYICFRIKEQRISNDYCKHYFDSGLLNKEIQKIAQEGARNHGLLNVSSEEFFQMCIHVPAEIKEQEAIAKILTTANLEIELLEKELEMIKEQKKALMELLLTGIVRVK